MQPKEVLRILHIEMVGESITHFMIQSPVVTWATDEIILFWGLVREPVAATKNWISIPTRIDERWERVRTP
jgi:hypothetical protein